MSDAYKPAVGLNPFVATMPPSVRPRGLMSGSGVPEGTVKANPGTGYTDKLTGLFWVKFAGVQELGWKQVALPGPSTGGGGTAAIQVFTGTGSPVGVVFPTTEAAFYTQQDSTPPGLVWSYYAGAWH